MCAAEVGSLLPRLDPERVRFVDCSAVAFDAAAFIREGVSPGDLMYAMHARAADGHWLKGIAVFAWLYQEAGLPSIAAIWNHPLTTPIVARVYRFVAKHRYALSRTGAARVIRWGIALASHRAALRTQRRLRRCEDGTCSSLNNPRSTS